jgi:hypothetical protein
MALRAFASLIASWAECIAPSPGSALPPWSSSVKPILTTSGGACTLLSS